MKTRKEFRDGLGVILAAAGLIMAIGMVKVLDQFAGISDNIIVVTLLILPFALYGVASRRLRAFTGPAGLAFTLADLQEDFAALEDVGGQELVGEGIPEEGWIPERPEMHASEAVEAAFPIGITGEREQERVGIYELNRSIFLCHLLQPSKVAGQKFDIFIFLKRHHSTDFSDVEKAEFYLGRYWGSKLFEEREKNGQIGIVTSAYGPFLCTCRITMKDGYTLDTFRYIDFEMGRLYEKTA